MSSGVSPFLCFCIGQDGVAWPDDNCVVWIPVYRDSQALSNAQHTNSGSRGTCNYRELIETSLISASVDKTCYDRSLSPVRLVLQEAVLNSSTVTLERKDHSRRSCLCLPWHCKTAKIVWTYSSIYILLIHTWNSWHLFLPTGTSKVHLIRGRINSMKLSWY